jgi:hypothetical protein
MVPRISRVAVMYGSGTAPGDGLYYLRSIRAEAHSKHLKMAGIRVNNPGEIERCISGIAREPDGALIVTHLTSPLPFTVVQLSAWHCDIECRPCILSGTLQPRVG